MNPIVKPIGRLSFQLYSARFLQPLAAQFEILAALGYRAVEPFGALFDQAAELQRLLDRHAMSAPSAHIGLDRLRSDAKAATRLCSKLGIGMIVVPAPPPEARQGDEAHWRRLGRELAAIGAIVAGEGLKFGYHNHDFDHARVAGVKTALDCLFEEAPDLLWEVDFAWIVRANADPVAELNKYANRAIACHIKDIAPPGTCLDEEGWADPGHGILDWRALRQAIAASSITLLIAEHDKPNDVARFARRARETIASWT